MGLGKTLQVLQFLVFDDTATHDEILLQTLALLAHLNEHSHGILMSSVFTLNSLTYHPILDAGNDPHLIVCPLSVLSSWLNASAHSHSTLLQPNTYFRKPAVGYPVSERYVSTVKLQSVFDSKTVSVMGRLPSTSVLLRMTRLSQRIGGLRADDGIIVCWTRVTRLGIMIRQSLLNYRALVHPAA